jgi:hypothetical protein
MTNEERAIPDTPASDLPLGTIDVDGRPVAVSLRVAFDGLEYVGRLWFVEGGPAGVASPVSDRGVFPGRSLDESLALARRLTAAELRQRYERARAERRRYRGLRRATEEILGRIRRLNQLGIAMRAGLLDVEDAAGEISRTEKELHDQVDRLRTLAGFEGGDDDAAV